MQVSSSSMMLATVFLYFFFFISFYFMKLHIDFAVSLLIVPWREYEVAQLVCYVRVVGVPVIN